MAPEESAPVALARRLLGDALRVRAGENVTIETWNHTLAYASACVVEARQRGARPLLLLEEESAFWRSLDGNGRSGHAPATGAHELAALAHTDAYVAFPGPAERPRYTSLPPNLRAAISKENRAWMQQARRAKVRAVQCLLGYASEPQAAYWGVSATTWRGQLLRGALEPDLASLSKDGRRARDLLKRGKVLRLTASNGTDLSMKLRGRDPYIDDGIISPDDKSGGRLMTTAPPGNVVVAVDERSADGIVIGSRPSYLSTGRVDGGQWEIHAGRLTNAWFTEGHTGFEERLRNAPRGRDVIGLMAVGLNPSLAPGTPQVEDQEAGAVTIAVGGNSDYGGSNRCPYLSWIVVGEATVAVDGKPLLDRGKLL